MRLRRVQFIWKIREALDSLIWDWMIILFISGRSVMRLRRVQLIWKIREAIAKSSFYFMKDLDVICEVQVERSFNHLEWSRLSISGLINPDAILAQDWSILSIFSSGLGSHPRTPWVAELDLAKLVAATGGMDTDHGPGRVQPITPMWSRCPSSWSRSERRTMRRTRPSLWSTPVTIVWCRRSRHGLSVRSCRMRHHRSMSSRRGTKSCLPVRVFTYRSSPTTRWMESKLFWRSPWKPIRGTHAQDGMQVQLKPFPILHSSHFHGQCCGIHPHPTPTSRSTMATRSSFTGSWGVLDPTPTWPSRPSSWTSSSSGRSTRENPACRSWWRSSLVGGCRSWALNVGAAHMLWARAALW